ncbi:hypothetical protein [Thioclava sp.]|uniref:hypothetical protein n=1 Tax=Thioclava sp. TaxID=1933450 RepID=UPI003241E916
MDLLWKVIGTFGTLTTIVLALVGAVYWAFKAFTEQWLQSKFDAQLEALRHDQAKEVERVRYRINALLDRASRMHGHEYRALPEIWSALIAARGRVGNYVALWQEFPDFHSLTPEQLEEALSDTPLSKTQRDHVRNASDRQKAYREAIYSHRKANAHDAARAFSNSVSMHAIFLEAEVVTPLRRLETLLWDALDEHAGNHEHGIKPRERGAHDALASEGRELIEAIERLFHRKMLASPDLIT